MVEMIRGKHLAQRIREKTKKQIEKMEHPPGLAAILVGNDPASHLYVSLKERAAKEVGIYFEKFLFPEDAKEKTIIQKVQELNNREDINGILVQLPLPNQDEDSVIAAIDPNKDIDGFHPVSRERLLEGKRGLVPPVALAVMRLIQETRQPLRGKIARVIANNPIFAEPIIELANESGVDTEFLPSNASHLAGKLSVADILIVAVGKQDFITEDMVKDGAIIIDIGTNKNENGKIVGDIAKEAVQKAAFKSPTPGGVGPLTVAYLLTNVVKAKLIQQEQE